MSGPDHETLTAALRRLGDEHASGVLAVVTPDGDVVLQLEDGVPVGIGPAAVDSALAPDDAPEGARTAALVDHLVDRTVAAIVGGGGDWAWEADAESDVVAVPADLVPELTRRAVDAAQALAQVPPDAVLTPGHDVETTGRVDVVRGLFDGERTLADVAAVSGRTVPATATVAAALLQAGAISDAAGPPEPESWIDAVKAADDDEDDEPELWVMEAPEDEEDEDDELDVASDLHSTDMIADPAPDRATADGDTATSGADAVADAEDEELDWFATSSPAAGDDPAAVEPAAAGPPAAASPDDVDEGWNDTSWLEDLSDPARDARADLSSVLSDLQGGAARPAPSPGEPDDVDDDEHEVAAAPADTSNDRRSPKAEPGEVAEFLRELSRLALEDD